MKQLHLPKCSSASGHDEHARRLRVFELVKSVSAARYSTFAVNSTIFYEVVLQMPLNKVESPCPAGENDTSGWSAELNKSKGEQKKVNLLVLESSTFKSDINASIFVDFPTRWKSRSSSSVDSGVARLLADI